jgi:hypothetical protein
MDSVGIATAEALRAAHAAQPGFPQTFERNQGYYLRGLRNFGNYTR